MGFQLGLCCVCSNVPLEGSMSLARTFTLKEYRPNDEAVQLNLFSQPIIKYDALHLNQSILTNARHIGKSDSFFFNLSSGAHGLLGVSFEWTVNMSNVRKEDFAAITVKLIGAKNKEEYLELDFEVHAQAFFFNRGNNKVDFVKDNPFFSGKMSVNVQPRQSLSKDERVYKFHAVLDKNIAEVYLNDGVSVSTNTFFLTDGIFIGALEVSSLVNDVYSASNLSIKQLGFEKSK